MPKSTAVAPVKPVPVIVTRVPPAGGPLVGLRPVTVGAAHVGELIGRRGGRRALPASSRSRPPCRLPAGLSAVIVVSLTTVRFVAAVVPKSTAVAPVKPVPVIVTKVPPAVGPLVGLRPVNRRATHVGELIGGRGGRRAARRRHGHVHRAGARRAVGRDRACR